MWVFWRVPERSFGLVGNSLCFDVSSTWSSMVKLIVWRQLPNLYFTPTTTNFSDSATLLFQVRMVIERASSPAAVFRVKEALLAEKTVEMDPRMTDDVIEICTRQISRMTEQPDEQALRGINRCNQKSRYAFYRLFWLIFINLWRVMHVLLNLLILHDNNTKYSHISGMQPLKTWALLTNPPKAQLAWTR